VDKLRLQALELGFAASKIRVLFFQVTFISFPIAQKLAPLKGALNAEFEHFQITGLDEIVVSAKADGIQDALRAVYA
jgi:hypothetical protein